MAIRFHPRVLRRIFGLFLLVGCVVVGCLFWAASAFVSGRRSPIQDSRMSWIESPGDHGIVLRNGKAQEGRTPYLLVSADPSTGPRKRAQILRRQLGERGVELGAYGESKALVVLLHGRNGRKEAMFPIAERFCAVGFHCVIPDLPASGESGYQDQQFASSPHGTSLLPDLLQSVMADYGAVLGEAREQVFVWGQSLGGCFGVRGARELGSACRGLVVVSTFDQLASLVEERIASRIGVLAGPCEQVLLPMIRVLGGPNVAEVRPDLWAREIDCPVLVVHGDADQLIAEERGRALYRAFASTDKTWISVSGASHTNALITKQPVYAPMAEWMLARLER